MRDNVAPLDYSAGDITPFPVGAWAERVLDRVLGDDMGRVIVRVSTRAALTDSWQVVIDGRTGERVEIRRRGVCRCPEVRMPRQ